MRLTPIGLTLAMMIAWGPPALGQPEDAVSPAPRAKPAAARRRVTRAGRAVSDDELRKTRLPRPSGNLHIYNVNLREELKINIYNGDGSYNMEGLMAVSHLMRCRRTDEERPMEPRLFAILSTVYDN